MKAASLACDRHLVRVRYATGTYTTSTHAGVKASCTAGDRQAVERLGEKMYGSTVTLRIEQFKCMTSVTGETWWHLYFPEAN